MRTRQLVLAATVAGLTLAVSATLTPTSALAYTPPRVDHVTHAVAISANTKAPTKAGSANWKLVYVDNFTKALNQRTAWSVYNTKTQPAGQLAHFAPSHVTESDGELHLIGSVDKKAAPDGRVVTGGLGLWERPQLYGAYTMLVRMDACTSVKYAWLLWPYNNVWPKDGEIDFGEDEGGNRAVTTASLNYAAANGSRATLPQDVAAPKKNFTGWHLIGVRWTPKSVSYYMDGQQWGKTKTTHIPKTPMVFVAQTQGVQAPGHVTLKGQCNADIGWVAQYKYVG
jgi:hypothetical protein